MGSAISLFDPVALAIVLGGTLFAAAIRSTREDIASALRAFRPLLRARPAADAATAAGLLLRIESVAELKGVACADHVRSPLGFVAVAARRLSDAAEDPERFARWATEMQGLRAQRHDNVIALWRTLAEAAPAMGMIGTVIGLVGMFATMDDPAAMGPAMATAMLTTLYGLFIAAGIAGPIASRLERLSLAERHWQETVIARLLHLARAERAQVVERIDWHARQRA